MLLQDSFGLVLGTDSKRVRAAAAVPASHEERQAVPLAPVHVLTVCDWCESKHESVAWLGCCWHILSTGVLRFAHVQRSVILRLTDTAVIGRGELGKSKRGGSRRPFLWVAMRHTWTGFDAGARLQSMLQKHVVSKGILPHLGPFRAPINELGFVIAGELLRQIIDEEGGLDRGVD